LEGLLCEWFRGEKSVGKKLVRNKKFLWKHGLWEESLRGKSMWKKKFSGDRDVGARGLFGKS
jgi:hypothetical protein